MLAKVKWMMMDHMIKLDLFQHEKVVQLISDDEMVVDPYVSLMDILKVPFLVLNLEMYQEVKDMFGSLLEDKKRNRVMKSAKT
ncbi:hypothetical protein E3N88_32602 [Mikania micrantha]|uniref:Uncharacterized protein n=1 Tax=Mikania micrantha TaxID=192012 RepID=A0A5N6M9H2_9ASTR|nr:hypothetical protein E3N88_32602 [Mikania micrantha]